MCGKSELMKNWFGYLQTIGKALMLPVAVLPAAALLLRLGAPDVFAMPFMHQAGSAIFDNLPLIFAIGIAVGISKDNHGSAGLAGAIGCLVLTSGLQSLDPDLNMGVLAGIVSGLEAGILYNRFHDFKTPEYLAFFSGKRFVPIITAIVSVLLAAAFGVIWGPCQTGIHAVGEWIIGAGVIGTFIYGVLNRLLIPLGLHHILNSFIWFVFGSYTDPVTGTVVHGDLNRFFAGDPSAGLFMAGFFPVMMFGMPAVALALYHSASAKNQARVGGALASVAFTAFLTGITEPLEFMFMFLAPALYVAHALLTGLSFVVTCQLGVLDGFGFSAGFIDYVLNWGMATNPARILPIGVGIFALYYVVFGWTIYYFNIPTIGRDDEEKEEVREKLSLRDSAEAILDCVGGTDNLEEMDNCITRIRMRLKDRSAVNLETLKDLALGSVIARGNAVQLVVGMHAEELMREIRRLQRKA